MTTTLESTVDSGLSAAVVDAAPSLRPQDVQPQDLIDLVYREARLLDAREFDAWNLLYTDDAYYWIPLEPDQPNGIDHTSHMYEDKLLRTLRIERLKSPRAYSQQPASRCHHLLQHPLVELVDGEANRFRTRTEFHYTEYRADEMLFLVGTAFHEFRVDGGALRFSHKRMNLINSDAALPSVQLFI